MNEHVAFTPIAPDSLAPAAATLRGDFLESNAHALGLSDAQISNLLATERTARVQRVAGGKAVVALDRRVLGGTRDRALEAAALGTIGDSDDVVVVFGLGTGDFAARVRRSTDAKVLVYEPHLGVLRCALEYGPLALGDTQVVTDRDGLFAVWPRMAAQRTTATLVRTPGYAEAFPAELAALTAMVGEVRLHQALFSNTYRERGRSWVSNMLENLPALARSIPFGALAGAYRGVPAFIVGAGPSLRKNVAALHRAAACGLVFATNSSVRTLARAGVEPQIVACLEAADMSPVLREAPFVDRAIRAFSMTAHPNTIDCGRGTLLPVWEHTPGVTELLTTFTGHSALSVSASVSTLCVSMALLLGCDPIVLVGHDLAYTDGRMYSSDSPFAESRVEIDDERGTVRLVMSEALREARARASGSKGPHELEQLCVLPAWGGRGTVASGPTFVPVRNWFSQIAALHASTAFVNATEGGARVDGFAERTLEDVVATMPACGITAGAIAEKAAASGRRLDASTIERWAKSERRRVRDVLAAAIGLERSARRAGRAVKAEPAAVRAAFGALEQAEMRVKEASSRTPLFNVWSRSQIDAASVDEESSRPEIETAIAREQRIAEAIAESARELEGAIERLLRRD